MGGVADAVGNAIGGAVDAVGSAIGSVADGVGNVAGGALGGISSLFGDALEFVGSTPQDLIGGIGGAITDAADFLNPVDFFKDLGSNIATLAGELYDGPLGDIAKAFTGPIMNFGEQIAGFAKSVFSGDFMETIKNTITDYPISELPAKELQKSLGNTQDAMNGIFQSLMNLDPGSPDFPTQLAGVQEQVKQLGSSDTIIGKMLEHIDQLASRMNPFR